MKRLLIIEDNEDVREDIVFLLEAEGYSILEAENGEIGLQIAQREPIDLIISDIQMPVMDGFAVLEGVRENATTAGIPFIFLTAHQAELIRARESAHQANDVILKPFTIEALLDTIHKYT